LTANNEDSEAQLDTLDESIETGTVNDQDLVVVTEGDATAQLEGSTDENAGGEE